MRNLIYTILILLTATTATAQSPTRGGGNNQIQSWYGGFKVIRLFNPPFTFNPWATYDSLGMVWIDSATTKKLMWHTGVYRRYVASERYVDSLFATAVTGVTQQTLDDSCASIRADISGGSTDSFVYSTRAWRQKGIDSVNINVALRELLSNKVTSFASPDNTTYPTTAAVNSLVGSYKLKSDSTATSGYVTHYQDDTGKQNIRNEVAVVIDTTEAHNTRLLTWEQSAAFGISASSIANWDQAYSNRVTSVATGYGVTGGTITATGTISADTAAMATRSRVQKAVDSLNINIAAKGSGTVTNVIGGTNISITGTSTIQPTVNITGAIAVANGGTGTTSTTSVNTTPITYGANNTVTASAATLTTTTLNPTVVTSSLTSVGTITSGTWSSTIGSAATGSTQAINNNSTQIATTAYVDRYHPVDTTISAAYTLTSRDYNRTIHCTNGSNIALTIPSGLGTSFTCVVLAEGAGTVTPTTSSTTFYYQPTSTTKIKSQGGATIRSWATANSYLIIGSLE